MIRYIITNRKLGIYHGIYNSEIFALESKQELSERMPVLEWSLEVLGRHDIVREYDIKGRLKSGELRIPGLRSLDEVRNWCPKCITPFQLHAGIYEQRDQLRAELWAQAFA